VSPAVVPAGVCLDPRDCIVMRDGSHNQAFGALAGDRGMELQLEPERTLGRLGQVGVSVRPVGVDVERCGTSRWAVRY
jgi:hypothetical protein